jgi:hypothetical protein
MKQLKHILIMFVFTFIYVENTKAEEISSTEIPENIPTITFKYINDKEIIDQFLVYYFLNSYFGTKDNRTKHFIAKFDRQVTEIGERAFDGCINLQEIIITSQHPTPPKLGIDAFDRVPETCIVYVPKQSLVDSYNNSAWGKYFKDRIKPISERPTPEKK